jgi:hypothetical protein
MPSGPFTYTVFVDDNFHYMDESERYKLGEFPTYAEAVAACKRLVEEYLLENPKPDETPAEKYAAYVSFGPDPFIVTDDPEVKTAKFSAWDYAKSRCGLA